MLLSSWLGLLLVTHNLESWLGPLTSSSPYQSSRLPPLYFSFLLQTGRKIAAQKEEEEKGAKYFLP